MNNYKTILVTGAGGYIGSVLVPKLLDQGYHVLAVDRFFFGKEKLKPHPNLTIIQTDCRILDESYFKNIEAVIDLVAISNDPSGEYFGKITYEVNYLSRIRTATLAKRSGVKRYILPSSCSVYGFHNPSVVVNEESKTNPLTTYAKANEMAEKGVLELASDDFIVTVIRQATVYGVSPRMRFDLAINAMTYGAWEDGILPLMRDGKQYRPMVHIEDTTDAMIMLLDAPKESINKEIFNVGSNKENYQLYEIAETIIELLPNKPKIKWYGDPDHRSYRVDFSKIEQKLGWKPSKTISDGIKEIYEALESGQITKTEETITLNWYKQLVEWNERIKNVQLNGAIFELLQE